MPSAVIDSPIGRLGLEADGDTLTKVWFHAEGRPGPAALAGVLGETSKQLDAYFKGRLKQFDLPLAPGGTPFQASVWDALQTIPYGVTRSYAEVAVLIGRPAAIRAVGAANGRNPIPIVIPCHRVIGSDGRLVGFGGGMETKRRLLDLECGKARLEI